MPFLKPELVGGELGVIEFLSSGDQMEKDASKFVGGGCDGLGCAKFGAHAAVEIAKRALAVVQGLRRHA